MAKDKIVEDEVNINPLGISSSILRCKHGLICFSRHFEGFKRCSKYQYCKIYFKTTECINMYVKKNVIHKLCQINMLCV